MAGVYKETPPTDEKYYGPEGWTPRRMVSSTHHYLYFGGELATIPPTANVRVDFPWNGGVANMFYGPGTPNGPFTKEGMNRSMTLTIGQPPEYYFVFVLTETPG